MTHADEHPNPDEGFTLMHHGAGLYWQRNEAGGRTYHSDEIPCGVFVWDTCLIDIATLCEAISMEFALLGAERRAAMAEQHRRQRAANPDARPVSLGRHRAEKPPAVRAADDGPCPNCGALGCWVPCPFEPARDESSGARPLSERAGDALPSAPARDRPAALLHVRQLIEQLQRAHKQLLRYSPEDPVAAEIAELLLRGPKRPE